jgi:hypothetical protein
MVWERDLIMFIVADENNRMVAVDSTEGMQVFRCKELSVGESTLVLRYAVVDGDIKDMYPGKTDAEVTDTLASAGKAQDAKVSVSIPKLAFYNRLTPNEWKMFYSSEKDHPALSFAKDMLGMSTTIHLSDEWVISFVENLVLLAILTEDRAKEVLRTV